MCLARAIVTGVSRLKLDTTDPHEKNIAHKEYGLIRKGRPLQKQRALEVLQDLNLPMDTHLTVAEIPKFEHYFNISIVVFNGDTVIYPHQAKQGLKDIVYLYYTKNEDIGHYDLITTPTGFLECRYFCIYCLKGYHRRGTHSCNHHCSSCGRNDCVIEEPVTCDECNCPCRSRHCLENHKTCVGRSKQSICSKYWYCATCHMKISSKNRRDKAQHTCKGHLCVYKDDAHKYFIKAPKIKDTIDKFVVFDFDCCFKGEKHKPLWCVSQTACDRCRDQDIGVSPRCDNCGLRCEMCDKLDKNKELPRPCDGCGQRQKIFSGMNNQQVRVKFFGGEMHLSFLTGKCNFNVETHKWQNLEWGIYIHETGYNKNTDFYCSVVKGNIISV